MQPQAGQKLAISGIKLSGKLVQINFLPEGEITAIQLFRRLAKRRVNLTMVTLDATGGRLAGACCIAAEELPRAQPVLEEAAGSLGLLSPVGALTVFPHRSRYDLLESILSSFTRENLPIHAIASSLAALTFITGYDQLGKAVSAVTAVAELPPNHAPIQPEFKVRQL
jgi:aspartokinase